MTRIVLFAIALNVALATAVRAQEPPPLPTSPVTVQTTPPATPPPTAPASDSTPPSAQPVASLPVPLSDDAIRRRRDQISIMEGALVGAVRNAAQQIARRMASQDAGPAMLSGSPTARGFIIEGYGVFFHVEVPGVNYVVVPLEALRSRAPKPAQPERAAEGGVVPPSAAPADADNEYVEAVKGHLIRAMIQASKPLELQPQEWFTIAAAGLQDTMIPSTFLEERATLVLRVRGADIADYMAERATLEQVIKKVEVRKF